MNINFELYRIFYEVANEGNIRRCLNLSECIKKERTIL